VGSSVANIFSEHACVRERVKERGLPGVGVADQSDHPERNGLARAAARGALASNGFDRFLDFAHTVANAPTIGFKFLFARSSGADTAAQTGKLFVTSCEARQQIVELRELDL
jgi:hypothetical protein